MAGLQLNLPLFDPAKRCSACLGIFPPSDFYPSAGGRHGVGSLCRPCARQRAAAGMRDWRRRNPEVEKARTDAWIKANPEIKQAQRDRWEAKNRERMRPHRARKQAARRAADREGARALAASWRERNRAKCQAYREARRALRANAPGRGVTGRQWAEVRGATVGICEYCSQPGRMTMDHIVPLVSGGAHDVDNVAVACRRCNQSKGRKALLGWLAGRLA